ncbi:MAG: bifunctional 3,4-dihydroxy-2-butanone-4-phosphate synthase/GTP cyclohydrolase II [Candidatus Hydrogenedens sp.]
MLSPLEEIIKDLQEGKMIILIDDEDRENEGDLVMAGEKVTPEAINFMAKYGRGLICVPMLKERLEELDLPPMTNHNTSPFSTAFHLSFDSAHGITTGISAYDRAYGIRLVADSKTQAKDLVRPGHLFPLCARDGGVLVRAGQTEGSIDLLKMANMTPVAVICEIMKDDGTMARLPDLENFAQEHNLKICSIEQIIRYRRAHEKLVQRIAEAQLPTLFGDFRIIIYESMIDTYQHIALVKGDVSSGKPVLVRVHSECFTGDVLASLRCDCRGQLHESMKMIEKEGCGIIVYMRQEGRGIGLANKIKAYALQDQGLDTVEANKHLGFDPDPREYGLGAQILADLGVKEMRLITNNPVKRAGLEGYGLKVVERVPLIIPPNDYNCVYLKTKKEKLGHLL